jgi:hypothetical protein
MFHDLSEVAGTVTTQAEHRERGRLMEGSTACLCTALRDRRALRTSCSSFPLRVFQKENTMKPRMALTVATVLVWGCASSPPSIFQKPATSLVVTQWVVANKGMTILAAFHNASEEEWMFFADVNPTVDVQVSVTLEELLTLDASLKELSDLPAGWKATRDRKGGPWKRQKIM